MPDLVNRVVRSKRRTIALVVERDGTVTVRAPMKMAVKAIHDFVQKHEQWIRKKQEEIRSMPVEQPRQYRTGELFLFLGRPYPLEIVNTTLSRLRLEHDIFQMPQARQHNAAVLFQNWYRQQARRIITERVYFFAHKHGIQVQSLRITSARTRWGSCSSSGTLSFSWRLLMTPMEIIDYVVIHELAHTVHHNHSKRFWSLVEKWMPEYRERRKQLKSYGQEKI